MDTIYFRAGFSSCISYDDFPVFIYINNISVYTLLVAQFTIQGNSCYKNQVCLTGCPDTCLCHFICHTYNTSKQPLANGAV